MWQETPGQKPRQSINAFRTTKRGPCSSRLCPRRLRNEGLVLWTLLLLSWKTAKLKMVSKRTSFQWREWTHIISYCLVLTFKSAKIQWLVKEILVSEALGIIFLWILIASIKMMTRAMKGCLILNKLGRRRMKLCHCQRVMATLQCWLLKCEHFYQVFPALPKLCSS